MSKSSSKRLVFTGGHHTSALAVAQSLTKRGWQVIWFGHRHSQWRDTSDSAEYLDVTSSGITFYDLKAGKFYHSFNILKLLRVPIGFAHALYLLFKVRPAGIVSFGGYLAVPTVIMGWLLGIPSVTHEQTVIAGWANKTIARFVRKVFLTWPQSSSQFPPSKSVYTGLPLRPGFPTKSQHQTTTKFPTLYITGGKQGSHVINLAVFGALAQLVKSFKVIHQTGVSSLFNDHEKAQNLAEKYSSRYRHFGFDSKLGVDALASADIVVSRAGAHTIYELALLGTPSVLIPIPWSSHNEQSLNAQYLAKTGSSITLSQKDLSSETLLHSIVQARSLRPKALDLPRNGLERIVELIEAVFI